MRHRALLSGASLALFLGIAGSGCDNSTAAVRLSSQQSALLDPFSDEAFRGAAACPQCTILTKATLHLPETGVSAVTAKLTNPAGSMFLATLLSDGSTAKPTVLLAAERAAELAKYGKLTRALYQLLESTSPETPVWIAMWEKVPSPRIDRKRLADPVALADFRAIQAVQLRDASAPILNKLAAVGATVISDGSASPLVLALMPAAGVSELAALDQVAKLDRTSWPAKPTGQVWYDSIGADAAHAFGTGVGQAICNSEGYQPDTYAELNVSGIRNPSYTTSPHTRWTTGIMQNIHSPVDSVAPGASMWIDDLDSSYYYDTFNWCSNTAHAGYINRSAENDSGVPGPSQFTDWYFDWLALQPPYPLLVAAAGNCGQGGTSCDGGDTVENRQYNGLVVGGSDTKQTSTQSDDTVWGGASTPAASWRNFTTDYGDYELPHLMAPAAYPVYAVGFSGSATSAATPQVTGTAAVVGSIFSYWYPNFPELTRALILATAVGQPIDMPQFTSVNSRVDSAAGVGLLSTARAASLAQPQFAFMWQAQPSGYWGSTVDLTNDFYCDCDAFGNRLSPYDYFSVRFPTSALSSGRLRAAIAWDATPGGCQANGSNCTTSVLDADLEIRIKDLSTGSFVGGSYTFDSPYEVADIPVTPGHDYELWIAMVDPAAGYAYYSNKGYTYLGLAWYNY